MTGAQVSRSTTYTSKLHGGDIIFSFTVETTLVQGDDIFFEPTSDPIFLEDGNIFCTLMHGKYNVPFLDARISSGKLTIRVGSSKIMAGSNLLVQCSNNLRANSDQHSAATFQIWSSKNLIPVQAKYDITDYYSVVWKRAHRSISYIGGNALGDLTVEFTPSRSLKIGHDITIGSNFAIFQNDSDIGNCTVSTDGKTVIGASSYPNSSTLVVSLFGNVVGESSRLSFVLATRRIVTVGRQRFLFIRQWIMYR